MSRSRLLWQAAAVCVVPLSFPLQQLELIPSPVPVIDLAVLSSVVLVVLLRVGTRQPLTIPSPLLGALALVVLSALVSTFVAADPELSIRFDVTYLLGLGLSVATALACRDARAARLVIAVVCTIGAGICIHGLATGSSLKPHYGGALVENRATGIFGQPNELGAFAVVIVVLSLALFAGSGRRAPRVLAAVSGAAATGAAAVSLSRGSWLGLTAGLVVLLVLVPRIRRRSIMLAGTALAAVFAVAVALPAQAVVSIVVERAASVVDGQTNPYDFRPQIWTEALRQIAGHPWLGVGPGGYHVVAMRSPSPMAVVAPEHAHNMLGTLAAEQGAIGVAALCLAVFAAARLVARSLTYRGTRPSAWPTGPAGTPAGDAERDRTLLVGVAAALAVVLGQGLIDYPLRNPVLATMVWLVVGLLASLDARRPVRAPSDTAGLGRTLVRAGPVPRAYSLSTHPRPDDAATLDADEEHE